MDPKRHAALHTERAASAPDAVDAGVSALFMLLICADRDSECNDQSTQAGKISRRSSSCSPSDQQIADACLRCTQGDRSITDTAYRRHMYATTMQRHAMLPGRKGA